MHVHFLGTEHFTFDCKIAGAIINRVHMRPTGLPSAPTPMACPKICRTPRAVRSDKMPPGQDRPCISLCIVKWPPASPPEVAVGGGGNPILNLVFDSVVSCCSIVIILQIVMRVFDIVTYIKCVSSFC